MIRKILAGAVVAALMGGAHAATDYPSGYTKCAQVGSTCTMSGTHSVALGKSGSFVYATKTGSFTCTQSAFPSNSYPDSAWCSVGGTSTSSSSSSTSSSTSSSSSSTGSGSASCKAGATISGTTVDCGGITLGTSCDGQSESQQPVISLQNGATIKNLHIKSGAAADGIHCLAGSCTLVNVYWDGVCEDAATLEPGASSLTITGGGSKNASDKTFQHNAANGTITVNGGFVGDGMGKLVRSCGDCASNGHNKKISINGVKLANVSASVVGVNSNYGDVATIRNLQIKSYTSGKPKVCVEYKGVTDHNGSSTSIGEAWNSTACNVSKSDVTAY